MEWILVNELRNEVASRGGDTILNVSKGTLEVYDGLECYAVKVRMMYGAERYCPQTRVEI